MSKITVTTQPKNRITINNRGIVGGGLAPIDTLVELKDVNGTHVANNNTVVYDEASAKFIVRELPIVNGGDF